jgi:hypothetical protein
VRLVEAKAAEIEAGAVEASGAALPHAAE